VLGIKGHANFGLDLTKVRFSFAGVTASAVPVLVEVCYATFATNSPGTASTSETPAQGYGRVTAVGATAARNWTTEPTVLTVLDQTLVTPAGGSIWYDFPLSTSFDSAVAEGFTIRMNAPANVDTRAAMHFERA
jgi:hypothetical protein